MKALYVWSGAATSQERVGRGMGVVGPVHRPYHPLKSGERARNKCISCEKSGRKKANTYRAHVDG